MRKYLLTPLLAAALLAGCATTQAPYAAPQASVPTQWSHGSSDARAVTGAWWTAFGDPALDQLVQAALAANNDLAAASIRVRRAQLQAGLADANLRPQLSGSVNSSAARSLDGGGTTRAGSSTLGASYEVDLWNRLGAQRDAARWEAQATVQDRESTAQALVGTTATLYWQLGYLRERITAAEASVAYAERTQALVQAQYRAGAVSSLEVAETTQTVASQRAALSQLQQQQVEAANALALLFDGQQPDAAAKAPQQLPRSALPSVAEGLPAELLGRRPDLRAAELRLHESYATIDATRASYYPALTLTGALGGSSSALFNVLQNPLATLGAGLSLPFLQRTQMDLNIKVSQTQYEEAVVNFRQTLYQALADVDNALSARSRYAEQATQLEQSLAAAQKAERLYETRYRLGAVPLRTWLDAQQTRRSAETALAENRYNQLVNHATLSKALGGSAGSTS
ncbi:efflux transporter outer membrane subunit [Xylophilus sp. GW821-FHT01B05]